MPGRLVGRQSDDSHQRLQQWYQNPIVVPGLDQCDSACHSPRRGSDLIGNSRSTGRSPFEGGRGQIRLKTTTPFSAWLFPSRGKARYHHHPARRSRKRMTVSLHTMAKQAHEFLRLLPVAAPSRCRRSLFGSRPPGIPPHSSTGSTSDL